MPDGPFETSRSRPSVGTRTHTCRHFFDPYSSDLLSFLAASCAHEIVDKLAALGVPIDIDALIAQHGRAGIGSSIAARSDASADVADIVRTGVPCTCRAW
jgi:cellulase/cellobiase CelA1